MELSELSQRVVPQPASSAVTDNSTVRPGGAGHVPAVWDALSLSELWGTGSLAQKVAMSISDFAYSNSRLAKLSIQLLESAGGPRDVHAKAVEFGLTAAKFQAPGQHHFLKSHCVFATEIENIQIYTYHVYTYP